MKLKIILLLAALCTFNVAGGDNDIRIKINNILNILPAGTRVGILVYNPLHVIRFFQSIIQSL